MRSMILTSLTLLLMSLPAHARPVSYPGGWTLMLMNNGDVNSQHLHYTLNPKNALGLRHEYHRAASFHTDSLQHNHLLKRWNARASQANLYIKSGIGASYDSDKQGASAFTGLAIDWEDRRYFTAYENRFFWSDKHETFARHNARIGIAPYIGGFGDLHTWLMLEAEYQAGRDDSFHLTPLVRLFKGTTLVEAGYNLDNAVMLNFVQRF